MRLSDDAQKTVIFFGLDKHARKDKFRGTGFFVVHNECGIDHTYLVTAGHVANVLDDGFFLRVNLKQGGSRVVDPEAVNWIHHTDESVDVAVTPIEIPNDWDAVTIPTSVFIDDEIREKMGNIGVGSLTYTVGLYRHSPGNARNTAVVHNGRVSLAPSDETIRVYDEQRQRAIDVKAFVVEASTVKGISGSPVFSRRSYVVGGNEPNSLMLETDGEIFGGGYADSEDMPAVGDMVAISSPIYLLGLWQGAWRSDSDGSGAPLGMGVVVPASRILETIEDEELKKDRQRVKDGIDRDNAAVIQ